MHFLNVDQVLTFLYRLKSETNPVLIKKIIIYVCHVMNTLT